MGEVNVFEAGAPLTRGLPADGERFVRALPATFSGTRARANLI